MHLAQLWGRYWCTEQPKTSITSPPPCFFTLEKDEKRKAAAGDPHTKTARHTMVKITVDTIWLLCFSPESVEMCTKLQLWSDPFTISAIPPSQNASRSSLRVIFSTSTPSNLEFLIPEQGALPVTCTSCSSAPSACWWSPVRFSSRSSLCEEFGKWWGYTAEWRASERHLPGRSDRTNWSLALQDRHSQTLSQQRGSERLKCFHPCWSSRGLYAVFTSSV